MSWLPALFMVSLLLKLGLNLVWLSEYSQTPFQSRCTVCWVVLRSEQALAYFSIISSPEPQRESSL